MTTGISQYKARHYCTVDDLKAHLPDAGEDAPESLKASKEATEYDDGKLEQKLILPSSGWLDALYKPISPFADVRRGNSDEFYEIPIVNEDGDTLTTASEIQSLIETVSNGDTLVGADCVFVRPYDIEDSDGFVSKQNSSELYLNYRRYGIMADFSLNPTLILDDIEALLIVGTPPLIRQACTYMALFYAYSIIYRSTQNGAALDWKTQATETLGVKMGKAMLQPHWAIPWNSAQTPVAP